jgi:hypothetical protein
MAARKTNMFVLQIENSFQRIDGTLETKEKKINLPIILTWTHGIFISTALKCWAGSKMVAVAHA